MKSALNNLKNKKQDSVDAILKTEDQQVNTTNLIKPLNFETVYQQYKNHISNDALKNIIKIPENDSTIKRLPKTMFYVNNGVPDDIKNIVNNFNVAKLCIDFFNSDWVFTIYRDISYNGEFWNLVGIANCLSKPNKQNFIIDEDISNQNCQTVFKTKGTYFENKLAVCDLAAHQKFLKSKEEELSRNTLKSSTNGSGDSFKAPGLLLFCLREHIDGNKILKESMPREGLEPIMIYLENVDSLKNIGSLWIKLSMKSNKDYYLYCGGKENRDVWMKQLLEATDTKKVMMSQDSLDRVEDSVQTMLTKFLQESENSSAVARKKDRQNILLLFSDVRTQIKEKAPPAKFLFDNLPNEAPESLLSDSDIRQNLQQTLPRHIIRIHARKFLLGLNHLADTTHTTSGSKSTQFKYLLPEPFYVTMSLIHLTEGRKITEDFYWNPNSSEVENMIPNELFQYRSNTGTLIRNNSVTNGNSTPTGLPTLPNEILQRINQFLVQIAYPLEVVCLLIKVEKVLSGPLNCAADKYIKHGSMDIQRHENRLDVRPSSDVKHGASLNKAMAHYCLNIGQYRQPFAWAASRLSLNQDRIVMRLMRYDNKTSDDDLIKSAQSLLMNSEPTSASFNSGNLHNGNASGGGGGSSLTHHLSLGGNISSSGTNTSTNATSASTSSSSSSSNSNKMKFTAIPSFVEFDVEELDESTYHSLNEVVNPDYVLKLPPTNTKEPPSGESSEGIKEIREFIFHPIAGSIASKFNTISHSSQQAQQNSNATSSMYGDITGHSNDRLMHTNSLSMHEYYEDLASPAEHHRPSLISLNTNNSNVTNTNSVANMGSSSYSYNASSNEISMFSTDMFSSNQNSSNTTTSQFPFYSMNHQIRPSDLISPFLQFNHCLYVYPRSVNFSKSNLARNISIQIELRDSDKKDALPLKAIFSRSSRKQPSFDTWANVAVLHHDSNPHFNEEIKIALPLNLHSRHHLLFRFKQISVNTAKKSIREKSMLGSLSASSKSDSQTNSKNVDLEVGYSWLSLLDDRNNLRNGLTELPVSSNLVDDYLDVKYQSIQWIENRKSIFNLVMTPYSTIYTQDRLLHTFFQICGDKLESLTSSSAVLVQSSDDEVEMPRKLSIDSTVATATNSTETMLKNAIKAICGLDVSTIIEFLGPIIYQLVEVVVASFDRCPDVSNVAVNTMMTLARRLRTPYVDNLSEHSRKRNIYILKSFIKYCFDADKFTPGRSKKSVHDSLVHTLKNLLTPPFHEHESVLTLLYNSFIIYNLIIKSMVQSVNKITKINNDNRGGEKYFTTAYQNKLKTMILLIIQPIINMISSNDSGGLGGVANTGTGGGSMSTSNSNYALGGIGTSSYGGASSGSANKKAGTMYNPQQSSYTTNQNSLAGLFNSGSSNTINGTTVTSSGGVGSVTDHIQRKQSKQNRLQRLEFHANRDLAKFLGRLLNVMDRGFVFERIYEYMSLINSRINEYTPNRDDLCRMKFEFIEILANHEHYIPLNLINASTSSSSSSDKISGGPELHLTQTYCERHYLAGLLLQQIHQQMRDVYSEASTRRHPIVVLRNLLVKHWMDERYREHPQSTTVLSCIAALYLPLVSIVLENKDSLCMPGKIHRTQHNPTRHLTITGISGMMDSRPTSIFRNQDSVSTNTTGSGNTQAGDTVSYVSTTSSGGRYSSNSSAAYLDKDGRVESHVLNEIAGITDFGRLRLNAGRISRNPSSIDNADNSSITSTNTIIGIEELEATDPSAPSTDEPNASLPPPPLVPAAATLTSGKSNSMSRTSAQSASNSLGKKSGLSLNFNLKRSTNSQPRTNIVSNDNSVPLYHQYQQQHHQYGAHYSPEQKSPQYLNDKSQKDLFLCLIHILGSISRDDLKSTIVKLAMQDRLDFLEIMKLCIFHLKYSGRKKINQFESISKGAGLSNQVQIRSKSAKSTHNSEQCNEEDKASLDGNMSVEAGLVILDVMTAFCSVFKQEILSYSADHPLFQKLILLYLTLLNFNQSETVLCHVFVSLRVFITNFAKVLFESCHTVLCDLSLYSLRFCDSSIVSVRGEACGFLYRMMRVSYDTYSKQGFNRVHLQMIVAVSKLDRTVGPSFEKSLHYLRSLAETEKSKNGGGSSGPIKSSQLSKKPSARSSGPVPPPPKPKPTGLVGGMASKINSPGSGSFFDEVVDLTERIRTVLMATMHMNEHKDDPEMLVDLQYSLAKSYCSNPALRRTWLEKIYAVHEKNKSRSEMAICKAHIAAMICEYLRKKEKYHMGCKSFQNISPNIPIEEGSMSDDSTLLEVHYTKEEVLSLLREVAREFDAAGLWEVMRYVYSLIIPIYESNREYGHLADIYRHLSDGYLRIKDAEGSNQRLIASYYRVVLYGKPFESLAGKVFIYRLAGGTPLCDAIRQFELLFRGKYGSNKVEMLTENFVDRTTLIDHDNACIQVTHVEPYFDQNHSDDNASGTLAPRLSTFDRHYNINRFKFETPFIKQLDTEVDSGVLQPRHTEDLAIQCKRRTILTVQSSFPHLKRRLEVVSCKEVDLSPIERAIDEIKEKNSQLEIHRQIQPKSQPNAATASTAVSSTNPTGKMRTSAAGSNAPGNSTTVGSSAGGNNIHLLMDMHLTGALLPQVNQGPMAYARVFLDKNNASSPLQWPVVLVNQLKIEFMVFLSQCHILLDNYYQMMSQVHEPKFTAMKEALDRYRIELIKLIEEEIIVNEEKKVISTVALTDTVFNRLNATNQSSSSVAAPVS